MQPLGATLAEDAEAQHAALAGQVKRELRSISGIEARSIMADIQRAVEALVAIGYGKSTVLRLIAHRPCSAAGQHRLRRGNPLAQRTDMLFRVRSRVFRGRGVDTQGTRQQGGKEKTGLNAHTFHFTKTLKSYGTSESILSKLKAD